MQAATPTTPTREPAWEIARLFPPQGQWTQEDYLSLTEGTNYLTELAQGCIEVLPMPKTSHQRLVASLFQALMTFAASRQAGTVLFAPLRVRLPGGTFREPDLVFMKSENATRMGEEYWDGADLVMEVLSDDNREHDLITKRAEYAQAGIPEYWIIDPREQRVSVLTLDRNSYVPREYRRGQAAPSTLLDGFTVDVAELMATVGH